MAGLYSERFLHGRGPNVAGQFVVPAGMRAVVRHLAIVAWTVVGQDAVLRVGAVPVMYWASTKANERASWDVRFVAYAGEYIEFSSTSADLSFSVDGFLFADSTGRMFGTQASAYEPTEEVLPGYHAATYGSHSVIDP